MMDKQEGRKMDFWQTCTHMQREPIVVVAVAFAGHDKEQKQNAAPGVLTGTVGDV